MRACGDREDTSNSNSTGFMYGFVPPCVAKNCTIPRPSTRLWEALDCVSKGSVPGGDTFQTTSIEGVITAVGTRRDLILSNLRAADHQDQQYPESWICQSSILYDANSRVKQRATRKKRDGAGKVHQARNGSGFQWERSQVMMTFSLGDCCSCASTVIIKIAFTSFRQVGL